MGHRGAVVEGMDDVVGTLRKAHQHAGHRSEVGGHRPGEPHGVLLRKTERLRFGVVVHDAGDRHRTQPFLEVPH